MQISEPAEYMSQRVLFDGELLKPLHKPLSVSL